jgi:hypothetical protein
MELLRRQPGRQAGEDCHLVPTSDERARDPVRARVELACRRQDDDGSLRDWKLAHRTIAATIRAMIAATSCQIRLA